MPSPMLSCVRADDVPASQKGPDSFRFNAHIGSGLAFPGLRSWLRGDLLPCSSLTVSGFTHPLT